MSTKQRSIMPWDCPRHGSWQTQPGSSTWSEARIARYGGGAQHQCAVCDGWVYCTEWATCPDELPLSIYNQRISKHVLIDV